MKPEFSFEDSCTTKTEKSAVFQENTEVKYEHVYQQVQNEMYEKIKDGECFNLKVLEEILLKNLLWKFNKAQSAMIAGVSIRTMTNKVKEYGLRDIRKNKGVLR
jgi:hypothetical protein